MSGFIDDKGRCCGRKPIVYKRENVYFCPRCLCEYSLDSKERLQNWAWVKIGGEFYLSDMMRKALENFPREEFAEAMSRRPNN